MLESKHGIIGLAIGDAMGVPIEFHKREDLKQNPITEMTGYGSHNMPKGTWSDDTSMTLATMDAIIEKKDIDLETIANNFCEWNINSKYTATGRLFDIGATTSQALSEFYWRRERCTALWERYRI